MPYCVIEVYDVLEFFLIYDITWSKLSILCICHMIGKVIKHFRNVSLTFNRMWNCYIKIDILIFQNGWVSALPYLTMWILSFPTCWLADYALKKNISRGVIRKVCNTIAHWGPAIALICLGTMSVHDATVATAILVIAVGLNAGSLSGFQINHIDISPNFAGTLMSITNCIASIIAIIAPIVCGIIAKDEVVKSKQFYLNRDIFHR